MCVMVPVNGAMLDRLTDVRVRWLNPRDDKNKEAIARAIVGAIMSIDPNASS